jgi:carbamoyl-phosphate synthase large subunit
VTRVAITGLDAGVNPQPGAGVIRSLRRHTSDITLVGLVYDAYESSLYSDDAPGSAYRIPYPSEGADAFFERLDQILDTQSMEVLLPNLDVEIRSLIQTRRRLERRGIATLLPDLEAYEARAKTRLPQLGQRCDFRTPRSIGAGDLDTALDAAGEIGYPVMIKGPYYEAYRCPSPETLADNFARLLDEWGPPILVQELVHGDEYDIVLVGNGEGGLDGLCTIRKTIRSAAGKGYGGITINNPELETIARHVVAELGWAGPAEFEFIHDERRNRFLLLEINPRFPAWVDFPSALGLNLPGRLLDRILGRRVTAAPLCPVGRFFVRHAVEYVGRLEDVANLSATGAWRRSAREVL